MDILAVRALSDEELSSELNDTYRELMNVRFRLSTRQLDLQLSTSNPSCWDLGPLSDLIARF